MKETDDEAQPVHRRTDHWNIEAAPGGCLGRRNCAASPDQRRDVLQMAFEIRWHGGFGRAQAEGAGRGGLEIDNNAAERSIRPLALGRKNYLFARSDTGGERAAAIYSLIETAK